MSGVGDDESKKLESDSFKNECRERALLRFAHISKAEDIELREPSVEKRENLKTGRWLSIVFVASKAVKITFQIHYADKDLESFVKSALKSEQVEVGQVEDFAKEYCNLVAGMIKELLQPLGVETLISLPLATRSSDKVFFLGREEGHTFTDRWAIGNESARIECEINMEVLDKELVNKIVVSAFGGNVGDGDVEFF